MREAIGAGHQDGASSSRQKASAILAAPFMNPRYPLKFHPVIVLVVSLIAAAIFALFIYSSFEGELRWFMLYYFTPIGIPFVAFLLDRAEGYALASKTSWAIDLGVLIPALTRAFISLPLVSGHALFLTYCC
jgi:hypothetical protein